MSRAKSRDEGSRRTAASTNTKTKCATACSARPCRGTACCARRDGPERVLPLFSTASSSFVSARLQFTQKNGGPCRKPSLKPSLKPSGVILRLSDEDSRSEIPALPERTSTPTYTETKCATTAGKFSHKLFVPANASTHHIKRFNRRRAYSILVFKRIDFLAEKRPPNCLRLCSSPLVKVFVAPHNLL